MFQSIILPLEIIMLLATAYIYWLTRKLVINSRQNLASSSQTTDNREQAKVVEMARQVAGLVSELQSVSDTVRGDIIRRTTEVQVVLSQANKVKDELQELAGEAKPFISERAAVSERLSQAPPDEEEDTPSFVSAGQPQKRNKEFSSMTFAEALAKFRKYLYAKGRSQSTVTRTIAHIRKFVTWLGGEQHLRIPLRRINSTQVSAYLGYMENQKYRSSTIKRKLAALQAFGNWIDEALRPEVEVEVQGAFSKDKMSGARPSLLPIARPLPNAKPAAGKNRYQAVFALANQGLDRATIASRTGLEREVVRMLLAIESPAQISH